LVTFGAVLKFALKIEKQALEFYYNNINNELFKSLVPQYEIRIKKLKRIRRENTTEMILEPIHGFESSPFEIEGFIKTQLEERIENTGKEVEKIISVFYNEAAKKIVFLNEVSNLFEEIAFDHERNSKIISKKLE